MRMYSGPYMPFILQSNKSSNENHNLIKRLSNKSKSHIPIFIDPTSKMKDFPYNFLPPKGRFYIDTERRIPSFSIKKPNIDFIHPNNKMTDFPY